LSSFERRKTSKTAGCRELLGMQVSIQRLFVSLLIAFRVILMEFYENYKVYSGEIEIIGVEVE
jgi:hypothetical protein